MFAVNVILFGVALIVLVFGFFAFMIGQVKDFARSEYRAAVRRPTFLPLVLNQFARDVRFVLHDLVRWWKVWRARRTSK